MGAVDSDGVVAGILVEFPVDVIFLVVLRQFECEVDVEVAAHVPETGLEVVVTADMCFIPNVVEVAGSSSVRELSGTVIFG